MLNKTIEPKVISRVMTYKNLSVIPYQQVISGAEPKDVLENSKETFHDLNVLLGFFGIFLSIFNDL